MRQSVCIHCRFRARARPPGMSSCREAGPEAPKPPAHHSSPYLQSRHKSRVVGQAGDRACGHRSQGVPDSHISPAGARPPHSQDAGTVAHISHLHTPLAQGLHSTSHSSPAVVQQGKSCALQVCCRTKCKCILPSVMAQQPAMQTWQRAPT